MNRFVFNFFFVLLLLSVPPGDAAGVHILPDGPVDGVVGRNVTLTTLLKNPEYLFIIWNYSDGEDAVPVATVSATVKKIGDAYQGRVSVNDTNGFLTLMALKPEDTGDYSLNVVRPDGTTHTGEIKLRVLEPVSDVVVQSNMAEAVELNSTVVLTCSAKGSFLQFSWFNQTTPIKADDKRITITESQDGGSSQLRITGILRSDLPGSVFCSAANKLETEKSAPFSLVVHYGPDSVMIHPSKPAQYIRARSSFNLTCTAVSSPAPSFSWFYEGGRVAVDGPVLPLDAIERLGLGKKEGTYTCHASNAKTLRTASSPPVTFGVVEPISGVSITGPAPSTVLVAGNSSAELRCVAAAGSVSRLVWLKDGKLLTTAGTQRVTYSNISISFHPVTRDDNGKFTCQLSNPVNTEQAHYSMLVNYGPDSVAVQGRDAVEVEDPVTLTCSAPSIPPGNYTWRFNGTVTGVKTATYTIDKAAYSHSGTYTCEVTNAVTGIKRSLTHTLAVKEELVEGLSDGAIAGIVIAVLVALVAAVALIFYCRQKVPVDPY